MREEQQRAMQTVTHKSKRDREEGQRCRQCTAVEQSNVSAKRFLRLLRFASPFYFPVSISEAERRFSLLSCSTERTLFIAVPYFDSLAQNSIAGATAKSLSLSLSCSHSLAPSLRQLCADVREKESRLESAAAVTRRSVHQRRRHQQQHQWRDAEPRKRERETSTLGCTCNMRIGSKRGWRID